jgi:hypothetical protein
MADTKVEQMSVNVVKEPSMMTGAIPRKEPSSRATTAIQQRKALLNT